MAVQPHTPKAPSDACDAALAFLIDPSWRPHLALEMESLSA